MKTLRELYQEHDGKVSDKWDIYIDEYDRLLSPYSGQGVSLLEIGVQNGGSLEIWDKYFFNAEVLVGCDVNSDCLKLDYDSHKIEVVIGNANVDETEKRIRDISRQFDIIIDDGSHTSEDIVFTFERYFPFLRYGGVFIVEDLHCSYWKSYGGGLYDFSSSISFFKQLVDVINHEHWGLDKDPNDVLYAFKEKYGVSLSSEIFEEIHSIEFINSLCIIRKEDASRNNLGTRNIVGVDSLVVSGISGNGAHSQAPRQDEAYDDNIHPLIRIEQRDQTIDELNRRTSTFEVLVGQLQDQLKALELESAQYKGEAERNRAKVDQLQDQLSALELESAQYKGEAASNRAKVDQLQDQFKALELESAQYKREALRHRAKAEQYGSNLNILQAELQQSRQKVEALESDVNVIHASTSWRITRPLRFVATMGYKGLKVLTYPVSAIRLAGGVRPFCRKLLNLYRFEGIKGLARGYRFVTDRSQRGYHQADRTYADWIKQYDLISETDRQRITADLNSLDRKPLISIVMPVYNPNLRWLEEAVASIKSQLYENWELCIADDNSKQLEVRRFLGDLQAGDDRIKVVFRENNGHISAASNSALEIASGEWVALMDQDDLLPEHALYWVVRTINDYPEAGLIYSDEDKIDEGGKRHNPYFKCDWNRSLFYSQNMISHLGVYKRSLVDRAGGFLQGMEGSQDHDLALRVVELLKDDSIIHVPKVLYHWRVHSKSTSGGADAKPYAAIAGEKAIRAHLERRGIDAEVNSGNYGYRVRYKIPEKPPKVSLLIPTRNGLELVRSCIDSIINKTTYNNYEIILIDNGSDDPECVDYFSYLESCYDNFTVKRDDRPFNYSALNNDAVRVASGEIIALVNNDIEVIEPDWLSEMVGQVLQPGVGAVGAKLLYPNGLVQHAGVIMGHGGVAGHSFLKYRSDDPGYFARLNVVNEYAAVTAACLVVKKSDFESVGGLNEADLKIAFNDVDFCLKLKDSGLRNVWTPYAVLYHHESVSRGYEDNPEKIARFQGEVRYMEEKWAKYIAYDPCYNPNLTLEPGKYFDLAWPPRAWC